MVLKHKDRQGEGEGDEEEKISINFKNATGVLGRVKVKKGTRVKDFLASLGHQYRKGLTYTLNTVLLTVDQETGELTDNPLLEEGATLAVHQTFVGGKVIQ